MTLGAVIAAGDLGRLEPHLVALAIGLLVGVERERNQDPSMSRVVGTRTFAVLALIGSLAGEIGSEAVAAALLAAAALLVAGYLTTRIHDPGITTEAAGLAVTALGAVSHDDPAVAVGLAVVLAVVLESKDGLRRFVRETITDVEVHDALAFFVVAAVVWPLLPEGGFGPDDVFVPRDIWRLVVVLGAVSWLGYLATRLLGPRRGVLVAGLSAGFVSAAATTAAYGRASRDTPEDPAHLAGAVMASVATCLQLIVLISVTDQDLATAIGPPLGVAALVLLLVAVLLFRRRPTTPPVVTTTIEGRPMAWRPTLTVAIVLGTVITTARWISDHLGDQASTAAAAAAGFADAHAAALAVASLVEDGTVGQATAIGAIGAALATNTITKVVAAFVSGGRRYALGFCAALAPATAVVAVGFWLAA